MNKNKPDKKNLLLPENMIYMYAHGAFPMADKNDGIEWYLPGTRAILRLDDYNFPRSLRKFMNGSSFQYKYDENTMEVVERCAARERTWISDKLIKAYRGLYEAGHLHSVEVFNDDLLIGGLYGVTFRGAFFGESMFSDISQSSKAALIKLIERLNAKGFSLLDIQFITGHLKMFGAVEISFDKFQEMLISAYLRDVSF
ncbi:MAG: leucyl/phenylalanyl-tRNA--protein transferase [Melioribacteraceae bacterium]|nr:leucyl/phenylalanyl-tRNA--protein transferase [Melioribacteraceae bacterium]